MPGQPRPAPLSFRQPGRGGIPGWSGSVHRLVHILAQLCVIEIRQTKKATTAGRITRGGRLLGNHGDRQAHQRAHIGASVPSARATSTTSYSLARPAITCATRGPARARCSRRSSRAHLGGAVQRGNGVHPGKGCGWWQSFWRYAHTASLRHGRNGAHGARGVQQRGQRNVVRIRKKRSVSPLTARTPTPWSMLKEPVFTCPPPGSSPAARVLEVQIGIVHLVGTISASARARWLSSSQKASTAVHGRHRCVGWWLRAVALR